jgi:hypothetical protein
MMRKNDGGPAHPVCTGNPDHWQKGMSLRDWFAGQALTGLLTRVGEDDLINSSHLASVKAYVMADAMIAERAKG